MTEIQKLLDLEPIKQRAEAFTRVSQGPDLALVASASARDVPLLVQEIERLRFHYGETKFMLEGWERTGETIGHFIPEHYEASEGAFTGIVEEWATHAAAVVDAAHTWRKCGRSEAWGDTLDAAVEKIYPSEDYL